MATREEIALLMWPVLIATAHERETITYESLRLTVGYMSWHIGPILEHIKRYCASNQLPPLTVLAVYKSGRNAGWPNDWCGVPRELVESKRTEVFDHKWDRCNPPTLEELRL